MSCTCEVHDTTTLSALHLSLHNKVQEVPLFFQCKLIDSVVLGKWLKYRNYQSVVIYFLSFGMVAIYVHKIMTHKKVAVMRVWDFSLSVTCIFKSGKSTAMHGRAVMWYVQQSHTSCSFWVIHDEKEEQKQDWTFMVHNLNFEKV